MSSEYYSRSPALSMRDAVLMVSPNRQYRGMVEPTTPATHGPVLTPIRIWMCSSGRCGTTQGLMPSSRSRDMVAISPACRFSAKQLSLSASLSALFSALAKFSVLHAFMTGCEAKRPRDRQACNTYVLCWVAYPTEHRRPLANAQYRDG